MKLYANQLPQNLVQGLKPCYMLFGEEPFQIDDSRKKIKLAAKQQGFEEFIRLSQDDQFDWLDLQQHCQGMSLFASKKLIELELTSSKMPAAGSDIIKQIANDLGPDTVLVLFGEKLDSNQTKAAWFKALDKSGCYIPVYGITGNHLERWLREQLQQRGQQMSRDAQLYLLDYTQGNLLACAQELDKLFMILGAQPQIELAQVTQYVANQSKYSVFQLMDSLWSGDSEACMTILSRLKTEELEPNIILWSLQKDLLLVHQLTEAAKFGGDNQKIFSEARVWKNKQQTFNQASRRIPIDYQDRAIELLNEIDLAIKSFQTGCVYSMFAHVCLILTGRMSQLSLDLPLNLSRIESL